MYFPASGIAVLGINNCQFPDLSCSNEQQQLPLPLRTDHTYGVVLTGLHGISQVSKQLLYGMSPTPLSSLCR